MAMKAVYSGDEIKVKIYIKINNKRLISIET